MSPETANLVHLLILGVGVAIWLVGLMFHRASFHRPDPQHPMVLREGEAEIVADPAAVKDRLVTTLRGGAGGGAGSFLIEEATDRRVTGYATVFSRKGGSGTVGFEIDLSTAGRNTRASYRILSSSPVGGLEWGGRIFVYFLSPAALATAAYLVQVYVLPSEDPKVRGQAIQTIQVVHFLWPAFLFGGLRRRILNVVDTMVANTLRNAAF